MKTIQMYLYAIMAISSGSIAPVVLTTINQSTNSNDMITLSLVGIWLIACCYTFTILTVLLITSAKKD
jgi:hypothetical protein